MTVTTIVHGIIGCGRVAPNHLDGFSQVGGCTVKWLCDVDPVAVAQLVDQCGGVGTADHADVLADPEVTSVSIAVGHGQHGELVMAALDAGKHVLVEKPLALEVAIAEQLVIAAAARRLTLSVVSQHRYDPLVQAVRSWVGRGLMGRIVAASASLQTHRDASYYADSPWRGTELGEGGSALMNQGYHCLDLLAWLLGPIRAVSAHRANEALGHLIETEDTLGCTMRTEGGALITLLCTNASPIMWRTRIEVVGQEGSVVFDIDHPDTIHEFSGSPAFEAAVRQYLVSRPVDPPPPGLDYYGISHRRQIADFCQAVRTGGPVVASGREGLATLRLLDAIYTSARADGRVTAVSGRPG